MTWSHYLVNWQVCHDGINLTLEKNLVAFPSPTIVAFSKLSTWIPFSMSETGPGNSRSQTFQLGYACI